VKNRTYNTAYEGRDPDERKVCTKCGRNLKLDQFQTSIRRTCKTGKLTVDSRCKECKGKASATWQSKNKIKKYKEHSELLEELSRDDEFKSLLINMGK